MRVVHGAVQLASLVWPWRRLLARRTAVVALISWISPACRPVVRPPPVATPRRAASPVTSSQAPDRRSFLRLIVVMTGSSRSFEFIPSGRNQYGIQVTLGSGPEPLVIPPPIMDVFAARWSSAMPNSGMYEVDTTGTLPIRVTVMNSVRYYARDSLATASVELPLRPFWSWSVAIEITPSLCCEPSFMPPVRARVPVGTADSMYVRVGGEARGIPFHVH